MRVAGAGVLFHPAAEALAIAERHPVLRCDPALAEAGTGELVEGVIEVGLAGEPGVPGVKIQYILMLTGWHCGIQQSFIRMHIVCGEG